MRHPLRAGTAGLALCASFFAAGAQAHGFGQRFDLPLPLNLWVWSAGGTIIATFIIAALFVREAPASSSYPHLRLAVVDLAGKSPGRLLIAAIRASTAALFLLTLAAGFFGAQDPYHNLEPTVIWVLWWVGVAYTCALIGNVWGLANPFATIFDAADRIYRACTNGKQLGLECAYPAWLASWPAVVIFTSFTWAELLWAEKDVPNSLAHAALTYSMVTWFGMFLYGRRWLDCAEAFSVMFGLMGRFAPLQCKLAMNGRRTLTLFLRPLGHGLLDGSGVNVSFVVFITTMLATVTFDGFLDTPLYQDLLTAAYTSPRIEAQLSRVSEWVGLEEGVLIGSAMLLFAIIVFCAAFFTTTYAMRLMARGTTALSSAGLACRFILSLVPIAIAYHLAHYLSLLLTAGQFIIPLISDPFGRGWNLFGTAAYAVDIGIVGPRFFWYASISAILVGHFVSVYLAHVIAIRLFGDRRTALLSQLPMVLLMVCYTMTSLWILAQPVVG